MNWTSVAVVASEAGEGAPISPYIFGAVGLGALLLLLVITLMINVDR